MFTLKEVQSIFDRVLHAYGQSSKKAPQNAVREAANAIATTLDNKKANRAAKDAVLNAGIEAGVFNADLSGNKFRVAFDKQFVQSLKFQLEALFNVQGLKPTENQSFIFGKGYFDRGLYQEAIEALTDAMEDPACKLDASYYLAKCYLRTNNYAGAEALFLSLTTSEQDHERMSDYYDSIGMCYLQESMLEKAMTSLELSLQHDNSNRSAQHNLALVHLELATRLKNNEQEYADHYMASQHLLSKLFEVTPNCPLLLHTQASWYELLENYEMAIGYYLLSREKCSAAEKSTLEAISVNLAECYAQRGHEFYQAGDYKSAVDFYTKALTENPLHNIVKNQLGMCALKVTDFDGARLHFNDLIKFPTSANPGEEELAENQQIHADGWMARATCLRKAGKFTLARGALEIAKDLAPDDESLQEERRELAATVMQRQWRFFKQHQQATPENPEVKEDNRPGLFA